MLSNMVAFMGPPTQQTWPEHTELPSYAERQPCLREGARDKWNITIEDPRWDQAARALLQWNPSSRQAPAGGLFAPAAAAAAASGRRSQEGAPGEAPPSTGGTGGTTEPLAQGLRLRQPGGDAAPGGTSSEPPSARAERTLPLDAEAAAQVPRRPGVGDGTDLCQCIGICGSRVCARVKNQNRRREATRVCSRRPLAGQAFCAQCRCETVSCKAARRGHEGFGRFCSSCVRRNPLLASPGPGAYANGYGIWNYPKHWSLELKLVASWAWALNSLMPEDAVICWKVVQAFLHEPPGELLDHGKLAAAFLAHTIKWPAAVVHFGGLLCELSGTELTAARLVDAYLHTVRWCDGQKWPNVFQRMNGGGRMNAETGLAVNGVHFGVLGPRIPRGPKRRRLAAKTSEATAQCSGQPEADDDEPPTPLDVEVASLGPAGSRYPIRENLGDAHQVAEHVLQTLQAAGLRWPVGRDQVPAFANGLMASFASIRRFRTADDAHAPGFPGGKDKSSSYHVKHFTRIVLLELERRMPDAFDDLTMQDIAQWTPDEGHYLDAISKMLVVDARKAFAPLSVLMIGCWGCLTHSLHDHNLKQPDQKLRAALKVPLRAVEYFLREFELEAHEMLSDDDLFPPGPRALFDMWEALPPDKQEKYRQPREPRKKCARTEREPEPREQGAG